LLTTKRDDKDSERTWNTCLAWWDIWTLFLVLVTNIKKGVKWGGMRYWCHFVHFCSRYHGFTVLVSVIFLKNVGDIPYNVVSSH
jgi:hypothetical protein